MNKAGLFTFLAVLSLFTLILPAGIYAEPAQEVNRAAFSDVTGKNWMLSEFRTERKTTYIDRNKLKSDNLDCVYSLSFNENQVSGMGAPNRYFAPYTEGEGKTLFIGNIASTMMFPFIEPEGLREAQFFNYLSKVTRWDLINGKLELYSSDDEGIPVVLVFKF